VSAPAGPPRAARALGLAGAVLAGAVLAGACKKQEAPAPEPEPARSIVGYARGDALTHAIGSGFSPLGPLRVWYRDVA